MKKFLLATVMVVAFCTSASASKQLPTPMPTLFIGTWCAVGWCFSVNKSGMTELEGSCTLVHSVKQIDKSYFMQFICEAEDNTNMVKQNWSRNKNSLTIDGKVYKKQSGLR
jgi:hypothetical protein